MYEFTYIELISTVHFKIAQFIIELFKVAESLQYFLFFVSASAVGKNLLN